MNKRLEQFLKAENISQSQFADSIGVARASVSHILAGRNKPGFDFIQSMARQYPAINLDWLITGKGKMFSDKTSPSSTLPFDEDARKDDSPTAPRETAANPETAPDSPQKSEPKVNASDTPMQSADTKRTITKIIIFFSDDTYQELK